MTFDENHGKGPFASRWVVKRRLSTYHRPEPFYHRPEPFYHRPGPFYHRPQKGG
jgi:hypothetical protein